MENKNPQDQTLEVSVPMQSVAETKNGVEKAANKKMFPGYVLLHMAMNGDTWYAVHNTRGVTGFVGSGSKPISLTGEEIVGLGFGIVSIVTKFEVGDTVVVTSSVWRDTVGTIEFINKSKKAVTIDVGMSGRETPVELAFTEAKKM